MLAAHLRQPRRIGRVEAANVRHDVDGLAAGRQDAPGRPQQPRRSRRARRPDRRAGRTGRRGRGCRPRVRRANPPPGTGAGTAAPTASDSESAPASAARAMRRSPGGRAASSARSRPELPPSSATVTTAVSASVTRAQRRQRDGQPVPAAQRDDPRRPRASRGARRSPGRHSRPRSRCTTRVRTPAASSRRASSTGDRDAAVLAARAADCQCHVSLALPAVSGADYPKQPRVGVEKVRA